MLAFALALCLAQDAEALIRQLDDDSPDVRERAAAQLKALGEKALPALKRSSNAHARSIAVRIEWEPFVPLWVEAKDARIFEQLAAGDPASFDRAHHAWPIVRKCLLEGPDALRRRALAAIEPADYGSRRIAVVLQALPHATEAEIAGPAHAIALSVTGEHAGRLRELAERAEPVRTAALLGLAAIGDADAQRAAIRELTSPHSWRRLAAMAALKRSPARGAGEAMRALLAGTDAETVLAILDTLEAYPDVDLRDALVGALSYAHKEEWTAESVRTRALQLIAARKYDLAARVWPLVRNGTVKTTPPSVRGDAGSGAVGWSLALVLSVGDEPLFVDRVEELRDLSWYDYVGVCDALQHTALPPRIDARLRAIAAGQEKSSDDGRSFAAEYVRHHPPPPPSPDELLAMLEKAPRIETLGQLPANEALSEAQRERLKRLCLAWLADKDHPLRDGAAWRLHGMKVKEGTDRLFELAQKNSRLLYELWEDPRVLDLARPLAKKNTWALGILAWKRDPSVPGLIMECFRERLHLVSGHGLGHHLAKYAEQDYTDDLLRLLTDDTPAAHVEQILAYLRLRGRKDHVALMRQHLPNANYNVRNEAIRAVGEWRDAESFDRLAGLIGREPYLVLMALIQIDRDRARPHLTRLFESTDYQPRSSAYHAFALTARRDDAALIVRLLQTDTHAASLAETAGRLGIAKAAPAMLDVLDGGYGWYAATGLAYLGERAAVPLLMERMDAPMWASQCLSALDLIVNRERYPALAERKSSKEGWLPFAEGRERARATFGVEIAPAAPAGITRLQFAAESDLVEFLALNTRHGIEGRHTHVWRDGAVHLVLVEEARTYWKAWWERERAK